MEDGSCESLHVEIWMQDGSEQSSGSLSPVGYDQTLFWDITDVLWLFLVDWVLLMI